MTASMVMVRKEQVEITKLRILSTAERLYAERGVLAVSNRQISEAAGQGNNFAVGYHFGGRPELVRAILDRHDLGLDPIRERMLAEIAPDAELRDWIGILVYPQTEYYASMEAPTHFGRFCAQIVTDPVLCNVLYEAAAGAESLMRVLTGMYAALPDLPDSVRAARDVMTRSIIVHSIADFENTRATQDEDEDLPSWHELGVDLVDALVGLWTAPVTRS
ncbi:TetR/AcrR family transcriptional regulator [Gordonia sp. CPCC 205515]|uniref:TetR/AcrR family transcriptional regulator n=1 Tax=Gordonia sp. CPCC 205515 TaxID=3140791 RepID=UPI003AF3F3F5